MYAVQHLSFSRRVRDATSAAESLHARTALFAGRNDGRTDRKKTNAKANGK